MRATSLAGIVSLALCVGCGPDEPPTPHLGSLLEHLPRDPLAAAVVWLDEPAAAHETLQTLYRLAAIASGIDAAELDRRRADESDALGIDLGDDLIVALGPEIALSLDLPPIDLLAGQMMQGSSDLVLRALGRVGLIARATDTDALRGALRMVLARNGAVVSEEGGLGTARFPLPAAIRDLLPPDLPIGEIAVHWLADDGLLAVGFDPEWLRGMLAPLAAGERLGDGADFRRVFGGLENRPLSLVYVNLPELRRRLQSSTVAQLAIAGNPDWERLWAFLNERLPSDIGLGQTTTRSEGRTVLTTRGPSWVPGLADLVATATAVAGPRKLARVERARQEATVARMRELATGIEAYALDHNAYPSARRIERLRELLEPDYLEVVPIYDGWGNPIRVLSRSSGYSLCSAGRDGGECSLVETGRRNAGFDDAIILQNGTFVQRPRD